MTIAKGMSAMKIKDTKEFTIVLKRMLAIMLTGMMLTVAVGFRHVNAQSLQDAGQNDSRTARVRMDVFKLGVGKKAQVDVKLRDNSKVKGYISEATDDAFTVVNSTNGSNQRIAYAGVANVKKSGGGFSARSWIILGAVAAGAVATWLIVKPAVCDGGAQDRGPC
jgi:hypothetical protein